MTSSSSHIAIIGGGPAGLMSAEVLATAGHSVTIYDRKSSVGRKFLMAGRGGLNLTHSEELEKFITRYGAAASRLAPVIEAFPPSALRAWCEGLGQEVFVGTSGRVFPKSFKASPLLRAWLGRLQTLGVRFVAGQCWQGWDENGHLVFVDDQDVRTTVNAAATILALGGASWPKLGSDGSWTKILAGQGIAITPLRPANCGFAVRWSDIFRDRYAGQPLKSIVLNFGGHKVPGEIMIAKNGIEGGPVYALSAAIRDEVEENGVATVHLDLRPNVKFDEYTKKLDTPCGALSFTNCLRKYGGLSPVEIGLLMERPDRKTLSSLPPEKLASLIKNFPLQLRRPFPIERAISTAGGIALDEVDDCFMLKNKPGVFAVGEMLDWEAPTGGYLLQACFSTAVAAAGGVKAFLARSKSVS